MGDPAGAPRSFAFGPFVLIPERQLLLQNDAPVRIGGRALEILTVLVEHAGDVVSKQELLARVWPDTFVEEANLKVNMVALRRVLGDHGGAAQYVATVIGRGYRFVAPVHTLGSLGPAIAAPAARHNLPAGTTHIVGRAEVIDGIRQELLTSRLVSIVGAGGIGKTTVALAVAEQLVGESFPDGVWLVDLAPLKDPALAPNAIATAIGLAAHSANMLAALCEFLRDRELLLVLDSCEHLIDAIAACAGRILAAAASTKIVVTSREPLRVKGERVRRLPGLATPPGSTRLSAAEALSYPAIQLFVERARERLESFSMSDAEAETIAAICRRLDGLALAIELAATRVDAFGVSELLEQLDQRISLLRGHRASVERHRTLTATIDWSYELLSDSERLIMRRLSTFAGAFSLASACAVAGDDPLERVRLVEDLAGLVDKSLLSADAGDLAAEYRLLDTTRSYALQKLAERQELDGARRRHAEHMLEVTRQAELERDRLTLPDWLARHGSRIDDVRDALSWACRDPSQAALAVALTMAAIPLWKQLSLVEECRAAVERALDERFAAHRSGREELILNLTLGAALLHTRGPLPQVKSSLSKALALAEQQGDTDLQLECLTGLSEYELWTGDSRSALALSEKNRALASQGHVAAGADADAQAGNALSWLGELGASRRHLENIADRPLALHPRSDAARFEFDQRVTARGTLATVLWLQGFPDQAVEMARRQREEAEASNHAVPRCYAILHGSVIVALYVHDLEAAGRFLDLGEAYAIEHGLTVWHAMATCTRGRWLLNSGKPFDIAAYRSALDELHRGRFRMRYANYLTNFGEGLARHGDFEAAHAAIDEAIALSKQLGQGVGIPEMLRIKGDVFRMQGAGGTDQAAECYLQSLAWARERGALSWELRSAMSLVELRRETGADVHAEALLAAAYARFSEGFWTGDLRRARALLERAR